MAADATAIHDYRPFGSVPLGDTECELVTWDWYAEGVEQFADALDVLLRLAIAEHNLAALYPATHVVYRPDPEEFELWTSPIALRALGYGDCEDIACDLAGLFIAQGMSDVRVRLGEIAPDKYHVTVITPWGEIDPALTVDGVERRHQPWPQAPL